MKSNNRRHYYYLSQQKNNSSKPTHSTRNRQHYKNIPSRFYRLLSIREQYLYTLHARAYPRRLHNLSRQTPQNTLTYQPTYLQGYQFKFKATIK